MGLQFLKDNAVTLKPAAFVGILVVLIAIGFAFGNVLAPKPVEQKAVPQNNAKIADYSAITTEIDSYLAASGPDDKPMTGAKIAELKQGVALLAKDDQTGGQTTAAYNSALNAISAIEGARQGFEEIGKVNLCGDGASSAIAKLIPSAEQKVLSAREEISGADKIAKGLFNSNPGAAVVAGISTTIAEKLSEKLAGIGNEMAIENMKARNQDQEYWNYIKEACEAGTPDPDFVPPKETSQPEVVPMSDPGSNYGPPDTNAPGDAQ
ncbi:MAG: hypothetical protein HY394_01425 [Candidatus Diapherotrites archaeon]|nr:hypothetical protein [Candidatus Diapherotrites archaeon]